MFKVNPYNFMGFKCCSTIPKSLQNSKIFDKSSRPTAKIDSSINLKLKKKVIQGIQRRCYQVPQHIANSVIQVFQNDPSNLFGNISYFLASGINLHKRLLNRLPPLSSIEKKEKLEILKEKYENVDDVFNVKKYQLNRFKERAEIARKELSWKPIDFDKTTTLSYLLARSSFDYACICRAFEEIKYRDPDFNPQTILDFGSGVGSNIWAMESVFGKPKEVFAVDRSINMNNLAKTILLQGESYKKLPVNYTFRLNLQNSNPLLYDLTTICFALLDQPSSNARLKIIENLWKKTIGYLVIIEEGTNAGFQVLSEVRNFLTQFSEVYLDDPQKSKGNNGFIFAPCPHSKPCPRYFLDKIPCNFDILYKNYQFNNLPIEFKKQIFKGKMTYLIFKKGFEPSKDTHFPRLVDKIKFNKDKITCRVCTNRGKLEEYVATRSKKFPDSKEIFHYIKYSSINYGDQIKINLVGNDCDRIFDIEQEIKKNNSCQNK